VARKDESLQRRISTMNRACAIALMVVAATTLLSFACFSGCARKAALRPAAVNLISDRLEVKPLARNYN
jgi:hypothetical protein